MFFSSAGLDNILAPSAGYYTKVGVNAQGRVFSGGLLTPADLPGGAYPGATNGFAVLSSPYTITADSVWQNTGLSISLPSAGAYAVFGHARGLMYCNVESWLNVRLYNVTLGAAIANSEVQIIRLMPNLTVAATAGFRFRVTVAGATTIRLEGWREMITGSGSWTYSFINSNSHGYTCLGYELLHT
jgi:hypothetical protein